VNSLTDATATQMVKMFDRDQSKLGVMYFDVIHNNEMYGQIVAYYRAKNMVPPSTADRCSLTVAFATLKGALCYDFGMPNTPPGDQNYKEITVSVEGIAKAILDNEPEWKLEKSMDVVESRSGPTRMVTLGFRRVQRRKISNTTEGIAQP